MCFDLLTAAKRQLAQMLGLVADVLFLILHHHSLRFISFLKLISGWSQHLVKYLQVMKLLMESI